MSDLEEQSSENQLAPKVNLRATSLAKEEIEAQLKAEIEKEEQDIEQLRAKAEERRQRQEEENRRKAEEKARIEAEKKAREEEEKRRREEVAEKKRKQDQEKKNQESDMVSLETGGSKLSNVLKAKEDMQKSPEQLEREKREIIASRLVRLDLNGKLKDDLIKQVEEFYEVLCNLYSQIYDLTEKHERQRYDMMELAERARQIEKGKAKTRKSNIVHTGLGGSVFTKIVETYPNLPQKISLFSRYERVTDRRTFKDRRDLWAVEKEKKAFVPEKPKAKLKSTVPILPRKKAVKAADEGEENNDEEQQNHSNAKEEHDEAAHEEEEQGAEEHHAEEGEEEQPAEEEE